MTPELAILIGNSSIAMGIIIFLIWYKVKIINPVNREIEKRRQPYTLPRVPVGVDDDYVDIKEAILEARTDQELHRVCIDIVIFKSSYNGYHAEEYAKKLDSLYTKQQKKLRPELQN